MSDRCLPECLSAELQPSLHCRRGLFLSRDRASHLSLLNFTPLLVVHSSWLSMSTWTAACPWATGWSPSVMSSANLTRGCLLTSSRLLVKTCPRLHLCGACYQPPGELPCESDNPTRNLSTWFPTQPDLMTWFGYKNIVGHSIESLAKVKVNYICFSVLVHKPRHFTEEGNKIGQAWLNFDKSMLTDPSQLLFLHVLRNVLWEDSLQEVGRPALIPWIIFFLCF